MNNFAKLLVIQIKQKNPIENTTFTKMNTSTESWNSPILNKEIEPVIKKQSPSPQHPLY